jgi:hypothetical protein
MTIRFKNADFSSGVISHSDNHFSTSPRESCRTSSSLLAVARSRRVLYTTSRKEDVRGIALNKFDSLQDMTSQNSQTRKIWIGAHAIFNG